MTELELPTAPPTKTARNLAIGAAAGLAIALAVVKITAPALPTPVPADICTGAYYYRRACDTTWLYAWPGSGQPAGTHQQGCSAHTWIVHAEDGKDYPIRDQYPPNPTQGGYPRPPAAAPAALAVWLTCYEQHGGLPPGYGCAEAVKPSGTLVYQMKTLAQVTEPTRHSFAALFGCGGDPVPTVPAPVTPGACPTCPPAPCVTPPRTPTRPVPTPPVRPTRGAVAHKVGDKYKDGEGKCWVISSARAGQVDSDGIDCPLFGFGLKAAPGVWDLFERPGNAVH